MIHSQVLKELSDEELTILWAVANHVYSQLRLEVKYSWIQMLRPEVVVRILPHINIKEEYIHIRDSLLAKLNNGGGF